MIRSTSFLFLLPALALIIPMACQPPEPKAVLLDREYGFQGYRLGAELYGEVLFQAKERASDYEVVEYESFGSRFADQQLYESPERSMIFGAPVAKAYAGVIDEQIYAFLLQIEADESKQAQLQDSLYGYYDAPHSTTDTTMYAGDMVVRIYTQSWEADSVGLDFGRGEGFAEILIYDKNLRTHRNRVQRLVDRSQRVDNMQVNAMDRIGEIRLASTVAQARWQYRFRGDPTHVRGGAFGSVDYRYVEPFFEVEGESLFGVKMAFVDLSFAGGSDSLRSIEVRFDNTQGQTVGFMDMLRVLERKLGRHAYSDTLHTQKGNYRRAMWYGEELSITLEENRLRPERPERADVLVQFELDRYQTPWIPPAESTIEDSTDGQDLNASPDLPS